LTPGIFGTTTVLTSLGAALAPAIDGGDPMKKAFALLLAAAFAAAAASCAKEGAGNPGFIEEKALQYGSAGGQALLLDLARPAKGRGPFPALVFIHSGYSMAIGDRSQYEPILALAAKRGYVAVSIDYRLVKPEASGIRDAYPAQIEDAKAAVRWLRANAKKYRIDSARIGAIGGGTAGTVAQMLQLTVPADGFEGDSGNPGYSSAIQAVVVFGGGFDYSSLAGDPYFVDYMGVPFEKDKARWLKASPLSWVRPGAAPALSINSTVDPEVPVEQIDRFDAALAKAGIPHSMIPVDNAVGAFDILRRLDFQGDYPYWQFLDKYLKPGK
jgi:acetyl esterase/lipase